MATLSSCSSQKGVSSRNRKGSVEMSFPVNRNVSGLRRNILEEARTWMGPPYKYAGQDKKTGTDCSGMVMRVYETTAGCTLPRNSAKQAEYCKKIKSQDVRPGDLVFFATGKDPEKVSHVGIMIDPENFIHASTSKGVVVSNVTSPYYVKTFIMYGRVPGI